MALFKKNKGAKELRLPDLPSASFPELPREESEQMPSLPSMPQMRPIQRMPSFPQLSPMPSMSQEETPLLKPMTMEINEESSMKMGKGPVFVKLEKFKDAMANFELVKKKINESSMLLDSIKETRAKEEEELNAWTNELNTLKEKISQIDRKIFSSLD